MYHPFLYKFCIILHTSLANNPPLEFKGRAISVVFSYSVREGVKKGTGGTIELLEGKEEEEADDEEERGVVAVETDDEEEDGTIIEGIPGFEDPGLLAL